MIESSRQGFRKRQKRYRIAAMRGVFMTLDELKEEYAKQNPKSQKAYEQASELIPGGITANVKFFAPFPLFMKSGHGARIVDVDGHEYVDYVLSYGPLIHGHGCPEIEKAAEEYMKEHGTILYGAPHEGELKFAQMIRSYFPSIESIRFTNSGTEATLLSIRTACAYTGKRKIAKFEGHYHGGFNEVLVSIHPELSKAGEEKHPNSCPSSVGIFEDQLENTIILPFNDLDACKEILTAQQDDIAGVIMEPLLGGTIPATKEFMSGIREITEQLDILMIMDEVKTGFCISMSGAQGYYGIKPDLTTLGKIIGAGMPIGLLGGKKDIMNMAAPGGSYVPGIGRKMTSREENLYHSGTYNGHPLILHMGVAAIKLLDEKYEGLLVQTQRLKEGIRESYASHGVRVLTPGLGAMFNVCITDQDEILTHREMRKCDMELRRKVDYALILEGIYNKPCKRYNMSTAHTADIVDITLEAYERAFKRI